MKDAKKGAAFRTKAASNDASKKSQLRSAPMSSQDEAAKNTKEAATTSSTTDADAEALLKADHRKVEKLFEQYESEKGDKQDLAKQICSELIVHTKLEEEIFYPACREKDVEDDALDEAQVEHDGAKVMIAELINGSPDDEYYDAKVTVLSEYIKHHVGEEEKAFTGIFAKAKKAGVDMKALGTRIQERKAELMEDIDSLSSTPPEVRSLSVNLSSDSNQEDSSMARYSNDQDRNQQGRFMGEDDNWQGSRSRSGGPQRSRYDDNGSSGWSQSGGRSRGEQGRSMNGDREWERSSSSRGGSSARGRNPMDDYSRTGGNEGRGSSYRDRDMQNRPMSENDDYGRSRSSSRGGYASGGNYGEDEDRGSQSSSRGGYASRGREFGEYGEGNQGRQSRGGYGGSDDRSSSWEERGSTGRSGSQSRRGSGSMGSMRDYEDDDRSNRSRSGGRGSDEGHGGWFGDPEGHSQAAKRGWQNR